MQECTRDKTTHCLKRKKQNFRSESSCIKKIYAISIYGYLQSYRFSSI